MKTIRRSSTLLLALILTCITPVGALCAGHHQSGIAGQLLLGVFPHDGEPVGFPTPGRILVHAASGRVVADIITDSQGHFVVAVKPGDYTLSPFIPSRAPGGPWLAGIPVVVRVSKKEFTEAMVLFSLRPQ